MSNLNLNKQFLGKLLAGLLLASCLLGHQAAQAADRYESWGAFLNAKLTGSIGERVFSMAERSSEIISQILSRHLEACQGTVLLSAAASCVYAAYKHNSYKHNCRTQIKQRDFFQAVMAEDFTRAAEFLAEGADINAKKYGRTALMDICDVDRFTQMFALNWLLEHGADVNAQDDYYGKTALHYAINRNHAEQVNALIKAGADVNLADQAGVTPLHIAVAYTSEDNSARKTILKLLLQAGAKINVVNNYGNSPLTHSLYRDQQTFHMLIRAGADVNLKNQQGQTELFYIVTSVTHAQYEQVRLLLAAGADPNIQDPDGRTALMCASNYPSNADVTIATELLAAGADPNLMDNDNYTALDCALKQHNRGMVELLLSAGAEVPEHLQAHPMLADHTSICRTPAFIRALTSPWPKQAARVTTPTEITKYLGTLWTNGINDYIGDPKNQTTLLMLVAELGTSPETPAIIEQLVRAGAKLNARDQHGRTALHRTFTIVQQHLRQQICPAPKDKVGDESPSYEIVHTYRSDELTTQIAAKLIELGIDINIKDYGTEPGWASEMATGAIVDAIDRRTALEYITGFPTQAYALLYRAEQAAAQANATKHAAFKCKIGDLKIS